MPWAAPVTMIFSCERFMTACVSPRLVGNYRSRARAADGRCHQDRGDTGDVDGRFLMCGHSFVYRSPSTPDAPCQLAPVVSQIRLLTRRSALTSAANGT